MIEEIEITTNPEVIAEPEFTAEPFKKILEAGPHWPTLTCLECQEVITIEERFDYWAELVDFVAQNGWVHHHNKCVPVPADRVVTEVPRPTPTPPVNLIKPAVKGQINKAKTGRNK